MLGAFGGRIDHEFSHYHILYKYPSLNIVLISHKRVAFLLEEGGHVIHDTHMGPMCGLVPLGHPSRFDSKTRTYVLLKLACRRHRGLPPSLARGV